VDKRQAVHRLYCLEGLPLRNKTPRRQASTKLRFDRILAKRQNEIRFMAASDRFFDEANSRVMTIADVFTRFGLAINTACLRGGDVVNILECVSWKSGGP